MTLVVAAALSEHPLATHAAGECIGHLLEALDDAPDAVVVTVTPPLLGALEDIGAAVRELLGPSVVLGCGAAAALGGAHVVDGRGALGLFGIAGVPGPGTVRPVRVGARDDGSLTGLDDLAGAEGTLVVLADTASVPLRRLADELALLAPGLTVVGGGASAATHPGGNRLLLDDRVHRDGAVGLVLPPEVAARALVVPAAVPVGPALVVTDSIDGTVVTLDGRPAAEVVHEIAPGATEVHLGRVVDPATGATLVREVRHIDEGSGVVTVDDTVATGDEVRLHVVDPAAAEPALYGAVDAVVAGRRPAGALVLTCTGRGHRLFGTTDVDAAAVAESVDGAPVGGLACAGQVGPVGGRTFAHSRTAVVLVLG